MPFYLVLQLGGLIFFKHVICIKYRLLHVKVIPQKKTFPMNFFETFPECSPPSIVSKKTKMIGHHSPLRDMMGQSYPIYACTRANHAHYSSVHVKFSTSSIETYFVKVTLGKKRER